jgi:hypothetical protein
MRAPDPLKFFDAKVRERWIHNTLNHPNGPVKIILVCYDNTDGAYYPSNLLDDTYFVEKIRKIESLNSTVVVIEIIDVENDIIYEFVQV